MHPRRDQTKIPFECGFSNTQEREDVWMPKIAPQKDFRCHLWLVMLVMFFFALSWAAYINDNTFSTAAGVFDALEGNRVPVV